MGGPSFPFSEPLNWFLKEPSLSLKGSIYSLRSLGNLCGALKGCLLSLDFWIPFNSLLILISPRSKWKQSLLSFAMAEREVFPMKKLNLKTKAKNTKGTGEASHPSPRCKPSRLKETTKFYLHLLAIWTIFCVPGNVVTLIMYLKSGDTRSIESDTNLDEFNATVRAFETNRHVLLEEFCQDSVDDTHVAINEHDELTGAFLNCTLDMNSTSHLHHHSLLRYVIALWRMVLHHHLMRPHIEGEKMDGKRLIIRNEAYKIRLIAKINRTFWSILFEYLFCIPKNICPRWYLNFDELMINNDTISERIIHLYLAQT